MIELAKKIARNSTFNYRIGAVLTKGGRILNTGFNKVGHKSAWKDFSSVHAEEAACNLPISLTGSTLYIARIKKDNSTGLAKPCINCMAMLKSLGIKKIVYTTDTGTITERI